jgi:hypothetical protein
VKPGAIVLADLDLTDVSEVLFSRKEPASNQGIQCNIATNGRLFLYDDSDLAWPQLLARLAELPGFDSTWPDRLREAPFASRGTGVQPSMTAQALRQSS